MKVSGKMDLVSIQRTFELQLKMLFNKDFPFKVISMLIFLSMILIPWMTASKYWWILELVIKDPAKDIFKVTYTWTTSLVIFYSIFYGILYYLNHPKIEQYKDNDVPWPWQSDPNWKKQIYKSLLVLFINRGLITVSLGVLGTRSGAAKFKTRLEDLPSIPVFVCQVLFLIIVEDFLFYWGHRLLHLPALYRHFHKWHHEYYNSIVLSSGYTHPVEFILTSFLPSTVGAGLLAGKCHILSMLVFLALRISESSDAHSGYDFPICPTKYLPLSAGTTYHNHHHLKNVGNFGSFFIVWDSIFGTNSYFFKEVEEGKMRKLK